MAPPPKLFDDSDSGEDRTAISINKCYARRFEHNKRREDLHRLADLQKRDLVPTNSSSSSSDEDEEDDVAGSTKTDLQFLDALVKVKRKDPVIHHKDAKLYVSDGEGDDATEANDGTKRHKPLYIKDVTARHLLEDGPEFEESAAAIESQAKVYSKEQEENRRLFLEAAAEEGKSEDEGEFFMEKKKKKNISAEDPQEDVEIRRKMDEYWGDDGKLDEEELFLKNFLMKKMWVGKGDGGGVADEDELSLDEDELEKQEKYEAEYNFRYEEGAGDRVLGHARVIEGSVRKKSSARREQRKRKEERMVQAEFERKEELKHLKNLKKKEIKEKLDKIRAIAGIGDGEECRLGEDDLEEEFDPEEYDRKMREMFGMDYYEAEDADPEFGSGDEDGLEKPDFDREDELLGLPKDWDVIGTGEGFKTARERSLNCKAEAKGAEEEDKEGDEVVEGNRQRESKRKRKRKISLREKVELDKELEEYYKLDYEDTIGDLKTRFKYKSVPSNKYGLDTAEILMADDKELNQYVSLKKLAPYRQDEWKVHKLKRHQMKMKLFDQGRNTEHSKADKKHHSKGSIFKESGNKTQDVVPNGEASGQDLPSRRSKRRHRQSELKLSQSRLRAYGNISHNSKKQKRH